MPRNSVFNSLWPLQFAWVKPFKDASRAFCTICSKDFDISNMGVAALTSHADGKRHKNLAELNSKIPMIPVTKSKKSESNGSKELAKSSTDETGGHSTQAPSQPDLGNNSSSESSNTSSIR